MYSPSSALNGSQNGEFKFPRPLRVLAEKGGLGTKVSFTRVGNLSRKKEGSKEARRFLGNAALIYCADSPSYTRNIFSRADEIPRISWSVHQRRPHSCFFFFVLLILRMPRRFLARHESQCPLPHPPISRICKFSP